MAPDARRETVRVFLVAGTFSAFAFVVMDLASACVAAVLIFLATLTATEAGRG